MRQQLLFLLAAAAAAVASAFELKAVDICDGRQSVVFREDLPLVVFDDSLPAAACNLSILVPAGSLMARLRYLAVRLFRPTQGRLDELRRRHGLCLEMAFSLRRALAPPGSPPLRSRRGCVSTEAAGSAWLFEDIPHPPPAPPLAAAATTSSAPGSVEATSESPEDFRLVTYLSGGNETTSAAPAPAPAAAPAPAPAGEAMVAEFVWRLVRLPGAAAPAATPGAATAVLPGIRLAFSVAPFFNCSGAPPRPEAAAFVHCQGTGGLCVPKRLACRSPVVSYLECPGRALFSSSVLDCAFYSSDVGFYLFLVLAGSFAVCGVLGCLLFGPIVAAVRGDKAQRE